MIVGLCAQCLGITSESAFWTMMSLSLIDINRAKPSFAFTLSQQTWWDTWAYYVARRASVNRLDMGTCTHMCGHIVGELGPVSLKHRFCFVLDHKMAFCSEHVQPQHQHFHRSIQPRMLIAGKSNHFAWDMKRCHHHWVVMVSNRQKLWAKTCCWMDFWEQQSLLVSLLLDSTKLAWSFRCLICPCFLLSPSQTSQGKLLCRQPKTAIFSLDGSWSCPESAVGLVMRSGAR